MASIKLTPNQFADIVVAFLLDAIKEEESILPNNPEFHHIIEKMKNGGMKAQLMSYYISMSSETRIKYKTIRPSFTGKDMLSTINIYSSPDTMKDIDDVKSSKLKTIVKKALKLIKFHKMKRNSGIPLNEEVVDKIIEKVLKEEIGE